MLGLKDEHKPVETKMNKLLIAIATALFTLPMLASAPAEAGGKKGFHRAFKSFVAIQQLKRNADHAAKRRAKRKAYAAKKAAAARKAAARKIAARKAAAKRKAYAAKKAAALEAARIAKAQELQAEAPTKTAESENSSITTSGNQVAEVVEPKTEAPQEVADASDLGCKKFFAAVGMTLSVPCE